MERVGEASQSDVLRDALAIVRYDLVVSGSHKHVLLLSSAKVWSQRPTFVARARPAVNVEPVLLISADATSKATAQSHLTTLVQLPITLTLDRLLVPPLVALNPPADKTTLA